MKKTCLITGAAGFIGFHISMKLLKEGYNVIGFDNLNNYYEVSLKLARLDQIERLSKKNRYPWHFYKGDLEDINFINKIFKENNPSIVINLAAQAGVRYSIENPYAYINSNIVGFNNIIECSTRYNVENFIYASSSSVYGNNKKTPFSEEDKVDKPVSLYAATKRSNELIAYAYSHIHRLRCTGIRFFTVYGPWGRPDMAPMIFAKSMLKGEPIKIFNNGKMKRDFTYIDDVSEILSKIVNDSYKKNSSTNISPNKSKKEYIPYSIFNIGNNNPVPLMEFINLLEKEFQIEAIKEFKDMQLGDVKSTYADISAIKKFTGIQPKTRLEDGIKIFVKWYKEFYDKNLI